jgi:hypothetical protein
MPRAPGILYAAITQLSFPLLLKYLLSLCVMLFAVCALLVFAFLY